MDMTKKLNTCPDCQGNGHFIIFKDTKLVDETTVLCNTCNGQTVLSDVHYAKFTEQDKLQAEQRWLTQNKLRRKNKMVKIGDLVDELVRDLRRGCY